MITNKEIVEKQLRRINEKMKTDFQLEEVGDRKGLYQLCRITANGYYLPPTPLSNTMTQRTEEQMVEYLAGVEDAVDFYTHCGTATV